MKTIGIMGRMGPEATVDMFHLIVKFTPTKSDEDHIPLILMNNPQIPSSNKAILEGGPSQ